MSHLGNCREMWFLLLLVRHSAKSSIAQEQRLDKAPPSVRDSSEVARAINRRCYPQTGNGGHSWCFEQWPILVRATWAQYHADGIY